MTPLRRRLEKLEASSSADLPAMTAADIEESCRAYEDLLADPPPPLPEMVAYWQAVDLHQLAADTSEYVRGGPAPWDQPEFRLACARSD